MSAAKLDHFTIIATGSVSAKPTSMRAKVLCVDDEFTVLESLERILRARFDVDKAASAQDAEDALRHGGPYAVVVSDLRLQETDGLQLLAKVRVASPDTVRVLITGFTDMETAIDAINDGTVFAFIRKPCRADSLIARVTDAVQHHQLLTIERTVAEESIRGAISAMNEMLALTSPGSVARARRLSTLATGVAQALSISHVDVELAALASQLAAATIDGELAERIARGDQLSEGERDIADGLLDQSADLLAAIPRTDAIRAVLRGHGANCDANRSVGAMVLRAVIDFDRRCTCGDRAIDAIGAMRATLGIYSHELLDALTIAVRAAAGELSRWDHTPRSVRRVAS